MIERWKYLGAADVTESSPMTPAPAYGTLAELEAAIDGKGHLVDIESNRGFDGPVRLDLTAGIADGENETFDLDVYVVSRTNLENDLGGVVVEKVLDITFTRHTTAIPGGIGGAADHSWPDGVSATSTGLLEARTSRTPTPVSHEPAMLSIPDVGPCSHILVIPSTGDSAASGRAIYRKWS